jgi:hypothetical protein
VGNASFPNSTVAGAIPTTLVYKVVEYAVSRRKQDETYTFTIQNWLGKGKWRNSYADLVKSLDPAYAIEYQEALKVKQNQSRAANVLTEDFDRIKKDGMQEYGIGYFTPQ